MAKSTSSLRGTKEQPERVIRLGETLETDYKSSYFNPSYDFPYNPDSLVQANNYSIYDQMRDDSQIKATLAIKKNMVIGNGWRIMCGDEVEQGMADKIKEEVTDMLENISVTQALNNTFEDLLIEVLSSYDYGFSLSEVIYKYEDGLYRVNKFVTRPPHTFEFDIDSKGTIISITQNTSTGREQFNSDIFFHFVYQPEFGNPYGKSDLKAAHEGWKAKTIIARYMNMYLEKYASPFAVMRYPSTLHPTEIERLDTIARKIKTSHSIVLPDDVTIELMQALGNTTDGYIKALEYYNLQISRSVLVPDLMGFGGSQTGGGSYALGKSQFNLFLGTISSDKLTLERKLTAKIIMPLVRANYGDYPTWFEFIPPSEENLVEYAKTWANAVGAKLWKPSEEEINHFRASMGYPEGDVEEVENPMEDAKIDQMSREGGDNGLQSGGNKDKQGKEKKEKEGDKAKEKKVVNATDSTSYFALKRQINRYEKKVNFVEIENLMNNIGVMANKEILDGTKDVINSIIEQVRMNPKAISKLQPKYLKSLNAIVKRVYKEMVAKSRVHARNEIFAKQFTDEDKEINYYEDIVENEAFKTVGDYSALMSKNATNMIASGLKNNVAHSEIVKIMRNELKSETEQWINTVVRTKTTEIFNETRKRFFESNEVAKEIVVAYQWSAILDTRTSYTCRELDGKIFDISEYTNIVKPPAHFNCRSLLVPITKFEHYKDDPNYFPPGTEPSIEHIQEKGGGLIGLTDDLLARKSVVVDNLNPTPVKTGKEMLIESGILNYGGNFELIVGEKKRQIRIISININNATKQNVAEFGFYSTSDDKLLFETVLQGHDTWQQPFNKGQEWSLPSGDSLYLALHSQATIKYTIEYEVI